MRHAVPARQSSAIGAGQHVRYQSVSFDVLSFPISLPTVAYVQARGRRIRDWREEAGHGLTSFARKAGISPSWLSRIERNQSKDPSPEVLKGIADALGVGITEIVRRESEAPDDDTQPP